MQLSFFFFQGWPIGPAFTPAHDLDRTYRHNFSKTFKEISIFECSLMKIWTMDICEERNQSLYVPWPPVSWIVTRTCTHLKDYLQHYGKYIEADLTGSQATNRKQEIFSCLDWGLNPGPSDPESSALPSELLLLNIYYNFKVCHPFGMDLQYSCII